MLDRSFAGFRAIFMTLLIAARAGNADIKQALTRTRGGADDDHQAMLCRTFAVHITFRSRLKTVALTPLRAVYKTPFF